MGPSRAEITTLFKNLSSPSTQSKFFAGVSDNVNWWIVGSTPMSKTYTSKKDFQDATLAILNGKVLDGPLGFRLNHVVVDSETGWATAEMAAMDATCRNGMPYPMRYCWVVRFGEDSGLIEEVRAYLDSELLTKAIEQNP